MRFELWNTETYKYIFRYTLNLIQQKIIIGILPTNLLENVKLTISSRFLKYKSCIMFKKNSNLLISS